MDNICLDMLYQILVPKKFMLFHWSKWVDCTEQEAYRYDGQKRWRFADKDEWYPMRPGNYYPELLREKRMRSVS